MKPPRSRRRGAAALVLAGLACLTNPPAGAEAATSVTRSATPATAAAPSSSVPSVPVMVVLDASGSMNEDDAPGPRIDAAKKAVKSLVSGLPATTQVGLTVYGTRTGSGAADKVKGCTDITTLVPVARVDAARISSAVDGIRASGYTPIGNALRAAAKSLPAEGPRSIVLVSDGEDTCAPPAPCDVAKDLAKQGVDLVVHTVGFKVDATARSQLACVAKATGGTYSDASDSDQLTQALRVKVDYAITGYSPKGTAVTGAAQPSEQAPLLQPGQYLDRLAKGGTTNKPSGPSGTTKYYTVPVQAGSRLYVGATLVPPTVAGAQDYFDNNLFGVRTRLLARDGFTCGTDDGFLSITAGRHEPATSVLLGDVGGDRYPSRCPTSGVAVVEVQRVGTAWRNLSLPLEIVVRTEPPADTAGVPPGFTKSEPGLAQPTLGTPVAVEPGSSFNDAAEVTSGTTYVGEIVTGEDHFFRVKLGWGQRFAFTVKEIGPAKPVLDRQVIAWMSFYDPLRREVPMTGGDSSGQSWFQDEDSQPFTGSSDVPVRYTNRDTTSLRNLSLDGDYYLRVSADFSRQRAATRYLITVVVDGTPEAGPTYQPGSNSPDDPSSAVSPTTAPSSTRPGTGAATGSGGDGTVVASGSTTSSGPGSLTILLVVLAAAGGAAAAALVVRARRAQPPDGPQT